VLVLVFLKPIVFKFDGALIRIHNNFGGGELSDAFYQALTKEIAIDAKPRKLVIGEEFDLLFDVSGTGEALLCFLDPTNLNTGSESEGTTASLLGGLAASAEFFEAGVDPRKCSEPYSVNTSAGCIAETCESIVLISKNTVEPVLEFIYKRVFLAVVRLILSSLFSICSSCLSLRCSDPNFATITLLMTPNWKISPQSRLNND